MLTEEDRQGLGGDWEAAYRKYGTAGMWRALRGVSAERAVVDVAHRLNLLDARGCRWLLRELGEVLESPRALIRAAVATGALVLVEHPRRAYWNRRKLPVAWQRHSALWDFLWTVCSRAKARKPIDRWVFGNGARANIVTQQKSRLVKLPGFSADLAARLKPIGRGTHQLDIAPALIRLFERSPNGSLWERTP
ncbi:MAG: hypothetical protein JNM56_31640 [Planctomycetia bacterium]|nr:hypothetical protein [Planctomycetia bacterium]